MRALVLVPLALLLLPQPAGAAGAPGSGFASLEVSAVASGQTYDPSKVAAEPVQLSSPYASSVLHLGAGNGIASIAWPGQLGASLGTTLIVAGGAPSQVEVLNDPVLANAKSGTRPDDRNTTVPGSTMVAHAGTTDVSSAATAAGVQSEATATGATYATSSAKATGPSTAVATATTSLRDVSIAGVVHIGGLLSTATGTTDGLHASAKGGTELTDVSIAGVAVSLGHRGLSLAGTALPTGALLAQVESVLARAQITLTVSQPTTILRGGSVQYATGSLVVSTPLGILSLGGATLSLAATPAYVGPPPAGLGSAPPSATATAPVGGVVTAPQGSTPVQTVPEVTAPSPLPPVVSTVVEALRSLGLTTGYRGYWVALGLLLALGTSSLLARLPARWLPALDDTCPLEAPCDH